MGITLIRAVGAGPAAAGPNFSVIKMTMWIQIIPSNKAEPIGCPPPEVTLSLQVGSMVSKIPKLTCMHTVDTKPLTFNASLNPTSLCKLLHAYHNERR